MKSMLLSILFISSCVQDNQSPESALKTFVDARIGHVVTRSFVLERVTGKMKQSMENVSDEEFTSFADMRDVRKNSFKVLSKSCQQKKCFITYSVSYLTKDMDKTIFTSEVKKIAEVINEEGKWLIADVSNIKTYHEALESINP